MCFSDLGSILITPLISSETPDSVSIRPMVGSVVEQREFQLRCDITGVAPAASVGVRWYRGNETFEPLRRGEGGFFFFFFFFFTPSLPFL